MRHLPLLFLLTFFLFGTCAMAAENNGGAIAGVWQTEKGGYVQIYHKKNGWFGRVVGSRNGKPRYDENNPDKSKRGRRLLGKVILWHLKYKGDQQYENGKIYNPNNGKIYSANAELLDFNTLHARGYIGFSFIGKTQTWRRIDPAAKNVHQDLLTKPIPPGPGNTQ